MKDFKVKSPCYFMCLIQDIPEIGHENFKWSMKGFLGADVYVLTNEKEKDFIVYAVKKKTGLVPNKIIKEDNIVKLLYVFSSLER